MKKLLVDWDILLSAHQGEHSAASLIEKGKLYANVQLWTMASSVENLVVAGLSQEQITVLLDGIAQIPVNALLNETALKSELSFETALLVAAAAVFKIPTVVSNTPIPDKSDAVFSTSAQALIEIETNEYSVRVDFMNLNQGLHPIYNRVDGWFTEIIQNTAFAGGHHVEAFEREFADYCGSDYAIGVSNGTDALRFALLAMDIGPGDEVITVANTFIATSEVITQIGATPVFVDVTSDTYTMDPDLLKDMITDRTKAILPVHLYGQVANMDRILEIADECGLFVLEDACQAHGAVYKGKRAGTFGKAGAFSMYPGKNLGAFGEAGCIITNDPKIDEIARCLRDHGQSRKYYHRMEGYNGRMDNLQAAALRAKLPFLDDWNQRRREIAELYLQQLESVPQVTLPVIPDIQAHVFHLFVILVPEPLALSEYLKHKNIHTAFHYPVPLHLQEAYQNKGLGLGSYPVSEQCAKRLISLPMYPELTENRALRVCKEITRFFSS